MGGYHRSHKQEHEQEYQYIAGLFRPIYGFLVAENQCLLEAAVFIGEDRYDFAMAFLFSDFQWGVAFVIG